MRTVAQNDVLEILKVEGSPQAQLMHNETQVIDQRCKWAMSLIQAWGMGAALGDIMAQYQEEPKRIPPVPPSELVIRVCEVVDAAWNEMRHRGWIIDSGSLGE